MAKLIEVKQDFDLGNKFLLDMAQHLADMLDDRFNVIIKYDLQECEIDPDKLNILIATSREVHDPPRYLDDENVLLICQNYAMLDEWGHPSRHPKVFPLPLGPFINDIFDHAENIKPFSERQYDFCFIGQLPHTGTRDKFKRCLDKMLQETGDKFKYYVKYTEAFNSGLSSKEYCDLLGNSKICLCPDGASSLETFRFFETLIMGSFPIVEKLPKFWYYEQAPMFFTKWEFLDNGLSRALNFLHSDHNNEPFIHLANYVNAILNPESLARILKSTIDLRLKNELSTNQLQNSL